MSRPKLTEYKVGDSLVERVKILRDLAWDKENGIRNPQFVFLARRIAQGCVARDFQCELRAIYRFTVENARYVRDVFGVDTFSSPIRTLQMGAEDCDGHAVLNSALAMALGYKAKVRITSNLGVTWDHIYALAEIPKRGLVSARWIPLDTTLARTQSDFSRFGVEPPRAKFADFPMEFR